jgi:hypothetical protein
VKTDFFTGDDGQVHPIRDSDGYDNDLDAEKKPAVGQSRFTGGAFDLASKPAADPSKDPSKESSTSKLSGKFALKTTHLTGQHNVNATMVGKIDGVKVVIKPETGLCDHSLRDNIAKGGDLPREVAAYQVAQKMGISMPETVVRDDTPHGKAVVQEMLPLKNGVVAGAKFGLSSQEIMMGANNLNQIALFDAVIGNEDRHGRNFLVKGDPASATIVPIDHGLSFPGAGSGYGNERAIEARVGEANTSLSSSEKALLRSIRGDTQLQSTLSKSLDPVDPEAVKMMNARIDVMLKTGKIDTVDALHAGVKLYARQAAAVKGAVDAYRTKRT